MEDVSLRVQPGKIVALVGENGSGKTTLVKLLCRFYDPEKGSITIDGTDLRELQPDDLWHVISAMFQDHSKYPVTARENIWFGAVERHPDEDGIIRAAQDAGADKMIKRLGNGYGTILSNWFKGGEELSSGEWQKMALARVFYKNSYIIILDEPTSFLDPRSERRFFEKLRRLGKDRATLLISHRGSTVRLADMIYVLDNGRMVESGTHEELLKAGGKYAFLFDRESA